MMASDHVLPKICLFWSLMAMSASLAADEAADHRVEEILFDARLTAQLKPYVVEMFDNDVARLVACGPAGVPRLIQTVRDAPMRSIRLSLAVDALGELQDPRGLPVLVEALGYRQFLHYAEYDRLSKHISKHGRSAIDQLIPVIQQGNPSQRRQAIKALSLIGERSAAVTYLDAIQRRDSATMAIAIDALGQLKYRPAEKRLIALFKELEAQSSDQTGNFDRQCEVLLEALGRLGGKDSSELMVRLVQEKGSRFRLEAARALGDLKSVDSIPVLIQLMGEPPPEPEPPLAVDSGFTPPCAPGPPPPVLHDVIVHELSKFGPTATDSLIAASNPKTLRGRGAITALALSGEPAAKTILAQTLADESLDRSLRAIAVNGLEKIAEPETTELLISASNEKPPLLLSQHLVRALVAIGQPARPALLRTIEQDADYPRWTAIDALCRINDRRDYGPLAKEVSKERNFATFAMTSFWELARRQNDAEINSALWTIADSKNWTCSYAIEILATRDLVDHARLRRLILGCLDEQEIHWQRTKLLQALTQIGCDGQEDHLRRFLSDSRSDVRLPAAAAIATTNLEMIATHIKQNPKDAVEMFDVLLPYRGSKIAQQIVLDGLKRQPQTGKALEVIKAWEWKAASDEVLKLVSDRHSSWFTVPAINTLASLGDTRAIDQTIQLAPKKGIRALAAFGRTAVDPVIELLDEENPHNAIEVLRVVGDRRAVKPLIEILEDPTRQRVHHLVVIALGDIGDGAAMEALVQRARRPGVSAHFYAEAMSKLPRSVTVPYYQKLLQQSEFESMAIHQLIQLGTPRATTLLRAHSVNASSEELKQRIGDYLDQ